MQKKLLLLMILTVCILLSEISLARADAACAEVYGTGTNRFSLATGSPGELGLLKILGETFGKQSNAALCWVKAGSGESLQLLKGKKVDMIMVHAPDMEKKALAEGWGANRTLIGSNEFFIVGCKSDTAKIASAKNAVEAYARIAKLQAKFFSRGDNSGTHKKEMDVWKKAGIAPSGSWYIVTKDFMTATLNRADLEKGYFMTDSSTWVAEKKNLRNLTILFRGDKFLVNTYHALSVPAGQSAGAETAAKFIRFVASEQGQMIIRDFGKELFGEGLYNDAVYAKKYDD